MPLYAEILRDAPPDACGALELLALEGHRAVDLIQSNPFLGFCLAHGGAFHKPVTDFPLRTARRFLTRRQREILEWLGFPGTESCAKLTRKIHPASLELPRCLGLRFGLRHTDLARVLAHLPQLNAGVLALTTEPRFRLHLTPTLLAEVAASPFERQRAESAELLRDIYRMSAHLRQPPPTRPFHSCRQIVDCHNDLVAIVNRQRRTVAPPPKSILPPEILAQSALEQRNYVLTDAPPDLPAPPRLGIETSEIFIAPIRSTVQLQRLAAQQRNCVASYAARIRVRECSIYLVFRAGQIFTLSLTRRNYVEWRFGDLRGLENSRPDETTKRLVLDWIKSSPQLPPPAPPPAPVNGVEQMTLKL